MATEEDRIGHLSQHPPKTASLMAPQAHPQHELLFKAMYPAESLEDWMERGLHRVEDEECVWLEGFAVLPTAYKGCNKESLLVVAPQVKTQVYPLPVEITEERDGRMRMLYHYTHRSSFERFVRIFASAGDEKQRAKLQAEEARDEEELTVPAASTLMLRQIQADWNDRMQRNTGRGVTDPELLLSEPGKFSNRQALNLALFGISKPGGHTNSGQKLSEIGDFCVAVKAPSSVLVACPAANGKPGAMRVEREALKTLEQQRHLRLAHQAQQALAEQKEKEERRKARMTCLGRLCGGGQTPALWDEEGDKEDDGLEDDGRVNRKKREVDQLKAERLKTWTKEHFIALQDKQREQEAEEAGQDASNPTSRLERLVMDSRRWLRRAMGLKEMDDDALNLYRQHMEKEATKKSAVGALERLKSGKSTNSQQLVRSLHSSKTRLALERIRQEDLEGQYDEVQEADNQEERSPEKKKKRQWRRKRRRKKPPGEEPTEVPDLEALDPKEEPASARPASARPASARPAGTSSAEEASSSSSRSTSSQSSSSSSRSGDP